MQAIAREEGLEFSLDRLNTNTFDLHRMVQYANDQGRGFEFFSDIQDGFPACAPTGPRAWSRARPASRSLFSTAGWPPRAPRRSRSTAGCWSK
jgi:hypothetical protein